MRARIALNAERQVATVDERVFGSFIEHVGRAIYGGVFEPEHARADRDGLRTDVMDLVRDLSVSVVRYPGGNFVSQFRWEDSIGPVDQRPVRLDLAWRSTEPNRFGLHEFMQWTRQVHAEPMLAFNTGTRGVDAARSLVEYCNIEGGTYWSDLRRANGAEEPFGVKLWCIGNEMDGPWQIGHKSAEEYGRLAAEIATAVRRVDPGVQLVVCGSSFEAMPTFPEWEAVVLESCYDEVDYLSVHGYYNNSEDNLPTFLGSSVGMDRFIKSVTATCDYVKARKRSKKSMYLSFDEWNVWYHSLHADRNVVPWQVGPALLEDIYNFEDALVVGCLLITLLKNVDRVKIACLAQLVNALAPIRTETGGRAWRQTTYWPFLHASRYGRGCSLDPLISSPVYDTELYGEVPFLEAAAVMDENAGVVTIFAVNRSIEEELTLDIQFSGFGPMETLEHIEMHHDNPKAENSAEEPDTVRPKLLPTRSIRGESPVTISLRPLSWNVLRLKWAAGL